MEKLQGKFSSFIATKDEEKSVKTELESAKREIKSLRQKICKIEANVDGADSYHTEKTRIVFPFKLNGI